MSKDLESCACGGDGLHKLLYFYTLQFIQLSKQRLVVGKMCVPVMLRHDAMTCCYKVLNNLTATCVSLSPCILQVRVLVFYGRRRYMRILHPYLERNLVANGGLIHEVRTPSSPASPEFSEHDGKSRRH